MFLREIDTLPDVTRLTYNVTTFTRSAGKDEDCLWAVGAGTVFKVIAGDAAKLASCKARGYGDSNAGGDDQRGDEFHHGF